MSMTKGGVICLLLVCSWLVGEGFLCVALAASCIITTNISRAPFLTRAHSALQLYIYNTKYASAIDTLNQACTARTHLRTRAHTHTHTHTPISAMLEKGGTWVLFKRMRLTGKIWYFLEVCSRGLDLEQKNKTKKLFGKKRRKKLV